MLTPRICVALMLTALAFVAAKPALAVNISDTGVGEALVFPYYTAVNGQVTLLSITNRTDKPKALKIHFREGMNGASVLSFNLFLAAQDVWTSVVVPSTDSSNILTADKSCATPAIPNTGLKFSTRSFAGDAPSLQTADRTREGYIEVFEMATIDPASLTGKDVSFTGRFETRFAACKLVSDQAIAANRADFLAPSGGITGSATVVSVNGSMSTGYDAIALQSLGIQTGATAAESASPDWTDVTNTTAMLIDGSDPNKPRMIAARFDRGVDAVSALFMVSALSGEYAFTNVLGADWIVTMPTKRLYVNNGAPMGPFQRPWNGASGDRTAKIETSPVSFTREAQRDLGGDCFAAPLPENFIYPELYWSAGIIKFRQDASDTVSASTLSSRNSQIWIEAGEAGCSNHGAVQNPKSEGGWGLLRLTPAVEGRSHTLVSRSDSTVISSNGNQTVGPLTFVGLPAIGIGVSAAIFQNARENYNSSYWLKGTRLIRQ